jgi:hypothetical protein
MAEQTPLYETISNAYNGPSLGLPNRDIFGQGIVAAADLAVTAHGGANSVDIAAGACWIVGDTDTLRQPTYRCFNDAIVNLGITPDPTNPRQVRVIGQINDADFSGVTRNWQLQALHGTPAGSPVIPAEPASAITLATILVPAAAASSAVYTITDTRARAIIGGGGVSIVSTAQAVRNSTFQSLVTATVTPLVFNDADTFDATNMHDPATNPSRMTVVTAGVHTFETTIVFAANATGIRGVGFRINGTTPIYGWQEVANAGALPTVVSTIWTMPLNAGDYVEVLVFQNSGGALNAGSNDPTTGQSGTYFFAMRHGA